MTHQSLSATLLGAACVLASVLPTAHAQAPIPPGNVIALHGGGNMLITFNAGMPGRRASIRPVTGLVQGEVLLGLDFRPSTGELYALGASNRLYLIDENTGIASAVSQTPFTPALSGIEYGFDFNPVPDRVRVVSDFDQSLRLNPITGAVAGVDTALDYADTDVNGPANPNIAAVAYSNNFAGAATTTLYGIDSNLDVLVRIGGPNGTPSPNGGQVFTVGSLGVDAGTLCGFDISAAGGALAALQSPLGGSSLYWINLDTGAATLVAPILNNVTVRDIAVRPPQKPRIFGVTNDNRLVSFRPGRPSDLLTNMSISGLAAGESLRGVDFRPSTGELYGLSTNDRLFIVDKTTAQASLVGSGVGQTLAGTSFGFDFNPVPDRIRVVSEVETNVRLNPITGALAATDTPLAYISGDVNFGADPSVVASAYTQNFVGTSLTTLYGIDSGLDVLVGQGGPNGTPSPNLGELTTIGALGFDFDAGTALDVSTYGGAFALTSPLGVPTLYTVNLGTGAATVVGAIAPTAGLQLRDISVELPVDPRVFAVTAANKLISFAPGRPGVLLSSQSLNFVNAPADSIIGLDFRPSTGQLIAVGVANRLYSIDTASGSTARINAQPFSTPLNDVLLGTDFNPVPDRLRIVTSSEQNLRVNANTGNVVGTDTPVAFAMGDANFGANPSITASAYTNSFTGTPTTTLYNIDSNLDALVRQGSVGGSPSSPNLGQLFTVGALGVDVNSWCGFDINPQGGALAAIAPQGGVSGLYTVNLTTGSATLIGAIGNAANDVVIDIAQAIRML